MNEEITITINGVEYIARPKEKVTEEVKEEVKYPTGYERGKNSDTYYYATEYGDTYDEVEQCHIDDDSAYDGGNYYTRKTIAENNARADKLMRQLRQWQALNDEPADWSDRWAEKWSIINGNTTESTPVCVRTHAMRHIDVVYFTTEEKAKEAIEVFRDKLMWYFTEYRVRLDEPERKVVS